MERMWQERADYGHFFYRIPNGESAADAYDRVSGFNDSLWRRFEENDFASVCILVTHGLMTRVFLMKWYHFSVEYFEDLRNVNHCEFVVMKKNLDDGKFILQNQLRTWSELKRERAARGSVSHASNTNHAAVTSGAGDSPIPQRRRWGGCPDGCDHSQHNHGSSHPTPERQNTADLFKDDNELLSSFPKDSSQVPSRHNSLKLNQTRFPPRAQPIRERCPQVGDANGDGAINSDTSVPDNKDTILDQDLDKVPLTTSSTTHPPLQTANRSFKHRYRNPQPVSMSLNETLLEEELPPNSRDEGVPTLKPTGPKSSSEEESSNSPSRSKMSPQSLRSKLRSPREIALISMAGRDGGGSRSGAGSSDEETTEQEEEKQTTQTGAGLLPEAEAEAEAETEDEDEDEESFPAPSSLSRSLTALSIQIPKSITNPSSPTPNNNPHRSSSLALALKGIHIPLNGAQTHNNNNNSNSNSNPNSEQSSIQGSGRAMADALGDQSDAEVTEDDEEMLGIKRRQKGEEERILEEERRERRAVGG